jgi:hypothetical protein
MMNSTSSRKLPKEIMPATSWRKVILLILLTLVMVFLTNLFMIGYLDKYSMNYGYWTIHQKWNLLNDIEAPVDWLILGDSSCSQGVMPEILMTELNQTAINLCTTGDMGTLDNLWMLEEYIQRFGVPKNVLVVQTFDMWHRNFNPVRLGQIPRPWKFWENHTFGHELMLDKDIRDETFIEHYVPLLSQNKTIGMIIRSTLAGKHNPFDSLWKMKEDGFVPAFEPKPDIVLAGEQQQIDFVKENSFSVSALNNQALEKMAEMADTNDFNLYLANSPTFEGLYTNPDYQEYFHSLQSYLQEVANQSVNIRYIPSVKTFPVEQMQNPDHLIVSGAEEYTRWLVEEILRTGR